MRIHRTMFGLPRVGLTQIDQDIATRASQRGQQHVRASMTRHDRADYRAMDSQELERRRGHAPTQRLQEELAFEAWLDAHEASCCATCVST